MNFAAEWPYLQDIQTQRLHNNKTPRHIDEYGTEIELMGAAGELAVRRHLGLPEVLSVHFDGGIDAVWRGWTIDVKSTKFKKNLPHMYLQWPENKPVKADIAIMVGVDIDNRSAELLGWAYKREVLAAEINVERKQHCREIPIRDLRPIWKLALLPDRNRRGQRAEMLLARP